MEWKLINTTIKDVTFNNSARYESSLEPVETLEWTKTLRARKPDTYTVKASIRGTDGTEYYVEKRFENARNLE